MAYFPWRGDNNKSVERYSERAEWSVPRMILDRQASPKLLQISCAATLSHAMPDLPILIAHRCTFTASEFRFVKVKRQAD